MLETKGQRTRNSILEAAAALATEEGLDPLSIGRLAEATGMSKSGLFAHFGSKEELQIATVRAAAAIFVQRVIRDAEERYEPGRFRGRPVAVSMYRLISRMEVRAPIT